MSDLGSTNPFTPTFGVSPPLLVGRESELVEIVGTFDHSVGDPYRATLITGLRGSGKTVFLNHVEDHARRRGWVVISETARTGLAGRLTDNVLPAHLAKHDPEATTSRPTSATVGVLGVSAGGSREVTDRYQPGRDLRDLLTRLAEVSEARGAGVLITVDELNRGALADLELITQAVQHCFREGRNVAFTGAGLPLAITALLDEEGTTFLRRAERIHLGIIDDGEVRRGIGEPLETWGRDITPGALDIAVGGCKGYPFMLQSIGHRLWSGSAPGEPIDADAARAAVSYAVRRVGDLVMAPELRGLSQIDRSYLAAMAVDCGPSRTSMIAQRLGVSPQYASAYRTRLLDAGLITTAGHGQVDLALPMMREYLREHVAIAPLEANTTGDNSRFSTARHTDQDQARTTPGSLPEPTF